MSFYLKYRPQKTSDLDIESVRNFYSHILKSGKFSHAYLFSGPRGTGKTSSARILAKIINCQENLQNLKKDKPLNEPCDKCDMCKRITSGSSLSVIEMDAASNRGIDDIRALRDKISLSPAQGQYIIYIIDEVHMLTSEAFNALLKTLEEPPKHAIFALCTTEFHKLPQTVISRCTQVLFPKATYQEISQSLKKVIQKEKIKISDASIAQLSKSVDGSFRDALKMLEQLSLSNKNISDDDVNLLVNRSDIYNSIPFIEGLIQKDMNKCMDILVNLESVGIDYSVFTKRILEQLRNMLLNDFKEAQGLNPAIISLIEIMSKVSLDIKTAFMPQLPLEITVVQWCSANQEIIPTNPVIPPAKNKKIEANKSIEPPIQQLPKKPIEKPFVKKPQISPSISNYPKKDLDHASILSRWNEVLAGVKPLNHSIEALLRASKPIQTDGSTVTVEVFYKFHKEQLEQDKYKLAIEQVISELFKSKVILHFILGEKTSPPLKSSSSEPESDSSDEDLVKTAAEIFS
jgi:DNA polymerase-3 subunit gamma/tau